MNFDAKRQNMILLIFRKHIYGRESINKQNRKRLKKQGFSIISSNCNGGFIYHDLGLQFQSPFINLYILPDDYLKLLRNLRGYMDCVLEEELAHDKQFPVGKLGDIHIFFQHYHSFEEAKEKWNIRKQRIDYDNLYILFADRDGCNQETIKNFDALPYQHKVCFVHHPMEEYKSSFYIKGFEKESQVGILSDFKYPHLGIRYLDQFDYVSWFND